MRGFSFVEVIVVVALLGLLVSVGTAVSFDYLNNQQLFFAGETIFDTLKQAQADADSQTDAESFGVKILPNQTIEFQGTSYTARTPSKDRTFDLPLTVTIPAASEVVFQPVSPFPVQATTLTIQNDRTAIDISINAYGLMEKTERAINN